jgi:hypothetical protein
MNGNDAEQIRGAVDELSQVLQQLGAAAYQQAGPQAGGPEQPGEQGGPGSNGSAGEDVVDGEFHSA